MAKLFQPLTLRSVTLPNRIVMSPMCQYSSEDGFINDWHFVHLVSRAIGGVGLVFTEATAVSPEGRITPADLGIWKDEHIEGLAKVVGEIKKYGAVPGIQLAHAGRKASHAVPWKGGAALEKGNGDWPALAPSALAYKPGEPVPAEMSREQIEGFLSDFSSATRRAKQAGFLVAEIHAAHGYLLHEFLSSLSNHRRDEYGGSFENRVRLLLQVIGACRKEWPEDLPLFVRISATDWVEGGWTAKDSVALASLLKDQDIDLIDCSSGGNSPGQKIPVSPLYQLPFAQQIKSVTGMMTGAVGLITQVEEAEQIIANGDADLVFIARQLLREPYFALRAAKELGADVPWPVQYERAKR